MTDHESLCLDALRPFMQAGLGAVDAGAGTTNFYCEHFADAGMDVVAIEPMPIPALVNTCAAKGIRLLKGVLSDIDGTANIYRGTDTNLNSLEGSQHFGTFDTRMIPVKSFSLKTAVNTLRKPFTILRIDIEGAEYRVIPQLRHLRFLPRVVAFEYGGGASKSTGQWAWNSTGVQRLQVILDTLHDMGYGTAHVFDGDAGNQTIDLQKVFKVNDIFSNMHHFGNMVAILNE